ncbi:MAG: hypothetical protein KBF75_12665 [Saprospiraceae bacterium]|nr:hypothetical protein [Saprospiraceae bacterium]
MSTADEVGRVFFWNQKVYRAIFKDKIEHINKLFSCGLLDELIQQKLIPHTTPTDYKISDFGLVLEHERIHALTYPYEWSFEMLKAAAEAVLKINSISRKYGYQMKDCHAYNVVFNGTRPVYVDIGSFTEVDANFNGLLCYEEFLRSYLYLLRIGNTTDYHWVKQLIASDSIISHDSYFLYKYPILRFFGSQLTRKITRFYFLYKSDRIINAEARSGISKQAGIFFNMLRRNNLLPFQNVDPLRLHKKISRLKKMEYKTTWGDYHNEFQENALAGNYRFERIIEILRGYNVKTVFEIAGNQGFFSRMMLEKLNLEHACCSDYDENAVDVMHLLNKDNTKLSPVLMNFLFPIVTTFTNNPKERFSSDLVIALAVTHHILLTQRIGIDFLFNSLKDLSKKYVAVEFMPLGLWDGKVGIPNPHWYTIEWFRDNFSKHFNLLLEEQLEQNRIIFLGERK